MAVINITSENRYLTRAEMEGNAEVIASAFLAKGWSLNAIAAMLGNMESESTINPGIWENLEVAPTTNGFGLVQWTPARKYLEWSALNGYSEPPGNIHAQIERIQYESEYENAVGQWIQTDKYPISFKTFSTSQKSPEYLAQAFLYNYERPASLNQPSRSTQARSWYEFIGGTKPAETEKSGMSKLLLYFTGTRRR